MLLTLLVHVYSTMSLPTGSLLIWIHSRQKAAARSSSVLWFFLSRCWISELSLFQWARKNTNRPMRRRTRNQLDTCNLIRNKLVSLFSQMSILPFSLGFNLNTPPAPNASNLIYILVFLKKRSIHVTSLWFD